MKKVYKKLSNMAKDEGYSSVEEFVLHKEINDVLNGLDRAYEHAFVMDTPKFGEITEDTKINVRTFGKKRHKE